MVDERKRYASWELADEVWEMLEPLLPVRNWRMGRPTEVDLHRIASGIFYVLRTGIQWNAIPREEYGPPSTVYYYFKQWRDHQTFHKLWAKALERYDGSVGLDWLWQALDAAMNKAPQGGGKNRPQSDGLRETGHETERAVRWEGDTAGGGAGWRQSA